VVPEWSLLHLLHGVFFGHRAVLAGALFRRIARKIALSLQGACWQERQGARAAKGSAKRFFCRRGNTLVWVQSKARHGKAGDRVLEIVFVYVAEAPKPRAVLIVSIEAAALHFKLGDIFTVRWIPGEL